MLNYDFPMYMADYIHRCGRAGRVGSGKDCFISNFVSGRREVELLNKIEVNLTLYKYFYYKIFIG